MNITEDMVKEIILEVLQEMQKEGRAAAVQKPEAPALRFREVGEAKPGTNRNEVVVGISPAFGISMNKTIIDIPLQSVLKEVLAGIEEEGLKSRLIRVIRTADVGFIAHEAAKLSGSGIGIGIQSRGTSVIHQKDLAPLQNLELFSQAPLVELETFRAMGRNAAKYAKGEQPSPVPVRNDPMARPRYQGLAALIHNKETQFVKPDMPSVELTVAM
ncbi:MAG: propanediol/glycerol family dehydratase medium subunit [Syntrophobacteraceae bacterium]|nr:propanediol/glycerol family dehydratase medium subunit [Syntrophobacteraceae bacterium]